MILQSQVPTQLFKEWLQGLKGGVLDQRTWSPRVTPVFGLLSRALSNEATFTTLKTAGSSDVTWRVI